MGKVERRIEIDAELLALADAAGIALQDAVEIGLRLALAETGRGRPIGIVASHLKQTADPSGGDERARQWALENAEAISTHNARIAERGVFGEDLRRW